MEDSNSSAVGEDPRLGQGRVAQRRGVGGSFYSSQRPGLRAVGGSALQCERGGEAKNARLLRRVPLGWVERARGLGRSSASENETGEPVMGRDWSLLPNSCHWLWEREGKEGVPRVCVPARGACVRVCMCELWAGTWSPLPVTPVLQMASLCLIPYRLRKICSSCRRVKTAPLSQRLGVPRGRVCLTLAGSSPHGSPVRD